MWAAVGFLDEFKSLGVVVRVMEVVGDVGDVFGLQGMSWGEQSSGAG